MSVVLGVTLAREVDRYVIESLNLQLEEERRMANEYREKFLHDGRLRGTARRSGHLHQQGQQHEELRTGGKESSRPARGGRSVLRDGGGGGGG